MMVRVGAHKSRRMHVRPKKSVRSSPMRRSYVRTCPSTDPVMIYVFPTYIVCTASRASSNIWIGWRFCDLQVVPRQHPSVSHRSEVRTPTKDRKRGTHFKSHSLTVESYDPPAI